MSVELYQFPGSLCSQKARLALAEKGVEWTDIQVNILKGDNFNPDYMKKNPKGVVPTLVHNGKVVTNSRKILDYVDAEFDGPDLTRGDPALMQAWLQLQDLMPMRTLTYGRGSGFLYRLRRSTVPWKRRMVEEARFKYPSLRDVYADILTAMKAWEAELWDAGAVPAAIEQVTDALDALNEALAKRTWLTGEVYTLADVAWTPVLIRLDAVGLNYFWTEGTRPHLQRYVEQVKHRPSFDIAITRYMPDQKKAVRSATLARYRLWIILGSVAIGALVAAVIWWPFLASLLDR